jgi:hypothetical protein
MRYLPKLKPPTTSLLLKSLSLVLTFVSISSYAYDLRWGATLGYGGAGVQQTDTVSGYSVSVQKSEGPGVGSLFVEDLMADNFVLGLESSFGFRFGPFSTGVFFTGINGKWYLYGPAIFRTDDNDGKDSSFYMKRYAPYYGFSSGVAQAHITRENDVVTSITSSGIYLGVRGGIDYSVDKDMTYRYEVLYNTTFMSNVSPSSTLTEFALQFGVYWFWK